MRKTKYHNRTKILLCYVLAWGIAAAVPLALLVFVYPYKLAGTAPQISLTGIAVTLPERVNAALATTEVTAGMGREALTSALAARDAVWRYVVGGALAAAWLASLLLQWLWRLPYVKPKQPARAAMRAVGAYHRRMLVIWLVNLACAALLYFVGVRFIAGKTVWDWVIYFCGFALFPCAAAICCRLCAPPAISGKGAYFRRL